jgi:hypothetical protein
MSSGPRLQFFRSENFGGQNSDDCGFLVLDDHRPSLIPLYRQALALLCSRLVVDRAWR